MRSTRSQDKQEGLSFFLQKQLLQKIEETGGFLEYSNNSGQKERKLALLLDSIPGFGKRGTIQRQQAKSCFEYWRKLLNDPENSKKLYVRFGIDPSISSSPLTS